MERLRSIREREQKTKQLVELHISNPERSSAEFRVVLALFPSGRRTPSRWEGREMSPW